MPNKIVITKTSDGTKKVIVGTRRTSADANSSKTIKVSQPVDRRPKPGTPKIGLTNEKNGYKYGGQKKFR